MSCTSSSHKPSRRAMNSVMLRTASLTVQRSGIPGVFSSGGGGGGGGCSTHGSPRLSLSMEANRGRDRGIRRAMSESDVVAPRCRLGGAGSPSFSSWIPQEDEQWGIGCLTFNAESLGRRMFASEGIGFHGGGFGDGFDEGSGHGGGGGGDRRKIAEYYEKMLRLNPGDSLLLRNYARYLHEVEGNTERAEEFYGRAILANPGDGEVLSMYAKLIWVAHGDAVRAKSYYDRAVSTSPDDCVVLGSYAQFLWESEEEEEEEYYDQKETKVGELASMVAAF